MLGVLKPCACISNTGSFECKASRNASTINYKGKINTTKTGKPCMHWKDSDRKFAKDWNHNYCRTTKAIDDQVWCYTDKDYTEWENCDVPLCKGDDECNCISNKVGKDAEIGKFCKEKNNFWDLENICATRNPITMNKKMRIQCKCARKAVPKEFVVQEHLETIQIYFTTGSFDKITKSAKTNFISRLSLIGGTLGLFCGFSILSGIEILFYIGKVIASMAEEKLLRRRHRA